MLSVLCQAGDDVIYPFKPAGWQIHIAKSIRFNTAINVGCSMQSRLQSALGVRYFYVKRNYSSENAIFFHNLIQITAAIYVFEKVFFFRNELLGSIGLSLSSFLTDCSNTHSLLLSFKVVAIDGSLFSGFACYSQIIVVPQLGWGIVTPTEN